MEIKNWECLVEKGKIIGRQWAGTATRDQLTRLRAAMKRAGDDPTFPDPHKHVFTVAERFFFLTHPAQAGDREASAIFWIGVAAEMPVAIEVEYGLSDPYDQALFVEGVAMGATERRSRN